MSVEDLDKESFDIFHREAIRSGRMSKDDLKLSNQDFSVGVPVQISVYKDKLYISNDCVFPAKWTADTLMQKHRSLPHNPDIANTFFRAGFIESWGRGNTSFGKISGNRRDSACRFGQVWTLGDCREWRIK